MLTEVSDPLNEIGPAEQHAINPGFRLDFLDPARHGSGRAVDYRYSHERQVAVVDALRQTRLQLIRRSAGIRVEARTGQNVLERTTIGAVDNPLTIFACRLVGIDPFAWLCDVLVRVLTHPVDRLIELAPRNWKPAE